MQGATRISVSVILAIVMIVALAFSSSAYPLEQLSQNERDRLSDYFDWLLAVDMTREEREALDQRITDVEEEIVALEETLETAEDRYLDAKGRTVTALRWIHRRGPTSYFEILIGATSIREFLRESALLRSVSRGALLALSDIRAEKEALAFLEDELVEKQALRGRLRQEREQLAEVEFELERRELELSEYFGAGWPDIRRELEQLIGLWQEEARPYLESLPDHFDQLVQKGLDPDDLTIVASLFTVRLIVPEEAVNRLLDEEDALRGAGFRFAPDEARLEVPDLRLRIIGNFTLDRQGVASYTVDAFEFAGLTRDEPAIVEQLDALKLDFSQEMQGMRVQDLTMGDGMLELTISFFP